MREIILFRYQHKIQSIVEDEARQKIEQGNDCGIFITGFEGVDCTNFAQTNLQIVAED